MDRPRREGDRFPRGDGTPRGSDGLPRAIEGPIDESIPNGFLFIDGQYIAPPYELKANEDGVTVNNDAIKANPPPDYFGRGFGGPGRGEPAWHRLGAKLRNELSRKAVVLAFADQPLFIPDMTGTYQLLKSLVSVDGRSTKQLEVRHQLPDDFDKSVWDEWVASFTAPDSLKSRAAGALAQYEEQQSKFEAQIRARRWLEASQYPLSVGAMILSVLSLGHLLGGRPHAGKSTRGLDASPEMVRALNWSLLFAAALSIFDLVWTILMANTNDIRELNPIGTHLIHDPRHLAGFKVSITFACLALIWLLRRHKRAQVAAWWICLVLTLLTCRWLMATSLVSAVT